MDPRSISVASSLFQVMSEKFSPSTWADDEACDTDRPRCSASASLSTYPAEKSLEGFADVQREAQLRSRTHLSCDFWRNHCVAAERDADDVIMLRSIMLLQVHRLCRGAPATSEAGRRMLNCHNVVRLLLVHYRRTLVEERLLLQIRGQGKWTLPRSTALSRMVHTQSSLRGERARPWLRGARVALHSAADEAAADAAAAELPPPPLDAVSGVVVYPDRRWADRSASKLAPKRSSVANGGWEVRGTTLRVELQPRPYRPLAALGAIGAVVVDADPTSAHRDLSLTAWRSGRVLEVYGYCVVGAARRGVRRECVDAGGAAAVAAGGGGAGAAAATPAAPAAAVRGDASGGCRASASATAGWTCSRCSFANAISSADGDVDSFGVGAFDADWLAEPCAMCGGPPPEWACSACTFINAGSFAQCTVCCARRAAPRVY